MKIYTKFGDKGSTKLYGGKTVRKNSSRVEAYGTADELCSLVGVIVAELEQYEKLSDIFEECKNIQQQLFDCGSDLATPDELREYKQKEEDVAWLEARIDEYMSVLPKLESFIIPGGHKASALIHQARTTTRRLERRIVSLMEDEEKVNEAGLKYVNRLSDYFFAAARMVNEKMGVKDTLYRRSGKVFKS